MNFINNYIQPITLGTSGTSLPLALPDGEYRLTIADTASSATRWEIVDAVVEDGTATLTRGREGTSAQEWPEESVVYCAITAGIISDLIARIEALEAANTPASNLLRVGTFYQGSFYPIEDYIALTGANIEMNFDASDSKLTMAYSGSPEPLQYVILYFDSREGDALLASVDVSGEPSDIAASVAPHGSYGYENPQDMWTYIHQHQAAGNYSPLDIEDDRDMISIRSSSNIAYLEVHTSGTDVLLPQP